MAVADLIRRFAEVSRALDKTETQQVQKLAEICKTLLRVEATDVLINNPSSSNLLQNSCECTPLKVRTHYAIQGPHHSSSRASVKESAEYFVQQLFFTTVSGNQRWQDRLVFREPLALQYGKAMPALAACATKFLKGTWCIGTPSGISIHHQIHDRGISRAFREAIAGHLAKLVLQDASLADGDATHTGLHLYTDAYCCLHDSHNAFRWGFQSVYQENLDQLLADLYVGISGYRSTVGKCIPCMCDWLDQVLTPLPLALLPTDQELSNLYAAVGVPSELLDTLSSEIHLIWRPSEEKLLVLLVAPCG